MHFDFIEFFLGFIQYFKFGVLDAKRLVATKNRHIGSGASAKHSKRYKEQANIIMLNIFFVQHFFFAEKIFFCRFWKYCN